MWVSPDLSIKIPKCFRETYPNIYQIRTITNSTKQNGFDLQKQLNFALQINCHSMIIY